MAIHDPDQPPATGFAQARLAVPLLLVLGGGFASSPHCSAGAAERPSGLSFLDNGTLRLGVDLDRGGAIEWLSQSKAKSDVADGQDNLVNNFDNGRQVQLSFYAGPIPFTVGDKRPAEHWRHLGWNPVQAGDDFGHGSRVVLHENDGRQIHVQCVPLQWPLDNVESECTFDCWITLEANRAHVRARLVNHRSDQRWYAAMRQELPAIYVNGTYHRLMTYTGDRPFTDAPLARIERRSDEPGPWASFECPEHWAALVRDDDWGLGVWSPDCTAFSGGFAGEPGQGGTKDSATGYLTPTMVEQIDHNVEYEFRYVLILDRLVEIRRYVYQRPERPAPPNYRFAKDRQHWHYVNATDSGWPIQGRLQIALDRDDPQLVGPDGFWQAADVPRLYVRAAYRSGAGRAELFFKSFAEPAFSRDKSVSFPIRPDGNFHVYEVDLSRAAGYRGAITGLRFDPLEAGKPGDTLELESITATDPASSNRP